MTTILREADSAFVRAMSSHRWWMRSESARIKEGDMTDDREKRIKAMADAAMRHLEKPEVREKLAAEHRRIDAEAERRRRRGVIDPALLRQPMTI